MSKNAIILTTTEMQSGTNRVKHAEGLIRQLPRNHDGRNTWLLNYGISDEAVELRLNHSLKRQLQWNDITESLNPVE
jgi:hypothetical protein